jgi:sugar diacid utilization regulator
MTDHRSTATVRQVLPPGAEWLAAEAHAGRAVRDLLLWPPPGQAETAEAAPAVNGSLVLCRHPTEQGLLSLLQQQPAAILAAGCRPGDAAVRLADALGIPLAWAERGPVFRAAAEQFAVAEHGPDRLDVARRGLLRAAASGAGVAAMTQQLVDLVNNPVLITDQHLRLHSYGGDGSEPEPDHLAPLLLSLHHAFKPPTGMVTGDLDSYRVRRGEVAAGGRTVPYLAVPIGEEEVLGVMLVLETRHRTGTGDLFLLREAATAAAYQLSHQRLLVRSELKRQAEFVNDLLYNNFESRASLLDRAAVWGWSLDVPHRTVVVELDGFDDDAADRHTIAEFQALMEATTVQSGAGAVTARLGERSIVLFPQREGETEAQSRERLKRLFDRWQDRVGRWRTGQTISAGAGNTFDITELYRSFQEAKTALELGRSLNGEGRLSLIRDLGLFRLLYTQSDLELQEFWNETMGALARHDAQQGAGLVATLKTYLDCDGDLSATASRLFVHPNTLRYRLDKIREITGRDVHLTEDRVNLYVALRVGDLRKF